MTFDLKKFDVKKYDEILARGLSHGLGEAGGQVCIESAICETLGLGHSDDPKCVAQSVRNFKIRLNDANWSSTHARSKGLRQLGLAQLGSLGVVENKDFSRLISEKTVRVLIPTLFREVFPYNSACLAAADRCEKDGSYSAANAAYDAAAYAANAAYDAVNAAASMNAAAYAANAAYDATYAAASMNAAYEAYAAANAANAAYAAANAARASDKYLILSANLALEVLRELDSPGVALL